jgi:hypothetical protein
METDTDDVPHEAGWGASTRLFQITEPDLAELERILPIICDRAIWANVPMDAGMQKMSTLLRKQIEKVRDIVCNVRWNYGPPLQGGKISA